MKSKLYIFFCVLSLTIFNYQANAGWLSRSLDSGVEDAYVDSAESEIQSRRGWLLDNWFASARADDLSTIEWVKSQVNINAQDENGDTALLNAIICKSEEVARFLLKIPELDVTIQNKYGDTALMWAVSECDEDIVTLLLAHPKIDINFQTKKGEFPLSIACRRGYENKVKLLLQMPGIKINRQNARGETPLELAAKHPVITQLMRQKINDLTAAAFEAIQKHDFDKLKSIVSQIGVDNITDNNLIADIDLLKDKAKTGKSGNTLVDKAFETNQPDIVLFLLQQAKDPQELLVRFPFEAINPSSELFEYCVKLAYGEGAYANAEQAPITKLCHACCTPKCHLKCSSCKAVYYCSAECQKLDWPKHKPNCKRVLQSTKDKE